METACESSVNLAPNQANIFPAPVFQLAVPGMAIHHQELLEHFETLMKSSEMGLHTNGCGYQTKANLLEPTAYPLPYLGSLLMATFDKACTAILSQSITDIAPSMPHHWVNTFNAG